MPGRRPCTTPWTGKCEQHTNTGECTPHGSTEGAHQANNAESIAWLVSPGLALIAVTYGLARFAYGLFLPGMRASFDLSPTLLGLIGAGAYFGYCVTIIAAMVCTSKIGARRMALAAATMSVLGMATVATSPTPWMLALGIVVAGSSTGLASPPMAAAVAHSIGKIRQDRANTLINSGTSVGVAVSGFAALILVDQWRLAWAVFALAGTIVLLWIAVMMPRTQLHQQRHDNWSKPGTNGVQPNVDSTGISLPRPCLVGSHVRARSLPLFIAAFGLGFSSAVYWTFSRELVVQTGSLGQIESTLFWIIIGIAGLVGGATGDLVQRFGLTGVLRGALVALAASMALLAVAPGVLAIAYTSAALFGSTYIILTGVILVWSVRLFRDRPAAGLGAGFLVIAAGQAAGSPVAGFLAGQTSLSTAFLSFAVVAMLFTCLKVRCEDTQSSKPIPGAPN